MQGLDHGSTIQPAPDLWLLGGQFHFGGIEIGMWMARLVTSHTQKLPVQRGEQPGAHLGPVPQLVPLGCPKQERLLGQIRRMVHRSGQPEGEPVKGGLMEVHQLFHVRQVHHDVRRYNPEYSWEYLLRANLSWLWMLYNAVDPGEHVSCWACCS
jgi:hypothetical protein